MNQLYSQMMGRAAKEGAKHKHLMEKIRQFIINSLGCPILLLSNKVAKSESCLYFYSLGM